MGLATGRRRFMTWIGAAGLTTSAAVFATSTPAAASTQAACPCCNLVYCPPNTSLGACQGGEHYSWSCRVCNGGCVTCVCCEAKSGGRTYASAIECRPT
jgi:hypothetical protein